MFGFIKKLLGFDKETYKDAGVQIEQAPYKVETPVAEPAPVVEEKVEAAPAVEVEVSKVAKEKSKAVAKKAKAKNPAQRGRKPKKQA